METFEPVYLDFNKEDIPVLQRALKLTSRMMFIDIDTMRISGNQLVIFKPTKEAVLFSVGMYYERLLNE